MAFSKFIGLALDGKPIPVYGDGRQTREFTYVGDCVGATIAAAERGEVGHVYNIGGGRQAELAEVIDLIETATGVPVNREFFRLYLEMLDDGEPYQRPGKTSATSLSTPKTASKLKSLPPKLRFLFEPLASHQDRSCRLRKRELPSSFLKRIFFLFESAVSVKASRLFAFGWPTPREGGGAAGSAIKALNHVVTGQISITGRRSGQACRCHIPLAS